MLLLAGLAVALSLPCGAALSRPAADAECSLGSGELSTTSCRAAGSAPRPNFDSVETALLQRSIRQHASLASSRQDDAGGREYDCNGDGVDDCGRWNYQLGMCHNQVYCGHIYRYP